MNGSLAQFVALTCHANAFLRGLPGPTFFPGNSTCQFCDWVRFINVSKTLFGQTREAPVASTPNDWFEYLKREGTAGIRITCTPQNNPGISDRMSSAFVGGGGSWAMQALQSRGKSDRWLSRWSVWNREAPERRIWRVEYGRTSVIAREIEGDKDLEMAARRLRAALAEIHQFSEKHNCGGFTTCFARAMETLDSGGAKRHGYHKDLVAQGVAPEIAIYLLDACQTAWVFGGMGSWNDMGFEGGEQMEYDRVSEQLFTTLNETIQSAANSSCVQGL